jgi:hypothetical protein
MARCGRGIGDVSASHDDFDVRPVSRRVRARAGQRGARKSAVYAAAMAHRDQFWKLEHLSNAQLLESLSSVLCSQQRTLAGLVAHLGEVEDRRLHLEAAYGSMFAYCVSRLGMSEDEACRRIELARLARKFPALFVELASGQLTLSVALLLKPVLSPSNHLELLSALRGKSIRQARELLAERFPKPDAPSSIRKLPERRPEGVSVSATSCAPAPPLAACPPLSPPAEGTLLSPPMKPLLAASPIPSPANAPPAPLAPAVALAAASPQSLAALSLAVETRAPAAAQHTAPALQVSRGAIEPLSAGRYRIQFTADAALKQQIERARDLLRHANPTGDFGPIVSRALELLIDDLMRKRFGARRDGKVPAPAPQKAAGTPPPTPEAALNPVGSRSARTPPPAPDAAASPACSRPPVASPAPPSRPAPVPRVARRAVVERDGLGCSWVAPDGGRCGSQAWLEFDHRHPAGKDGGSEPENLRLLCRAHNQLAAEQAYGRKHIEWASKRRRETPHSMSPPA